MRGNVRILFNLVDARRMCYTYVTSGFNDTINDLINQNEITLYILSNTLHSIHVQLQIHDKKLSYNLQNNSIMFIQMSRNEFEYNLQ
jgi:hypothetical protein